MIYTIIIALIFVLIFLINFVVYWIVSLKIKNPKSKFKTQCMRFHPKIWNVSSCSIPIVNSSFFQPFFKENISYFYLYWIWFLLIGLLFIGIAIRLNSLARTTLKTNRENSKNQKLVTKGVYEIIRHPIYSAWFLIFLGFVFVFDSLIGLIFSPILILLTEVEAILKEKYVLIPKFGMGYQNYKKNTPYRIISPPYNYLFIIIAILVLYIGAINFGLIS